MVHETQNVIVLNKWKALYYFIPKVVCTSLKTVFATSIGIQLDEVSKIHNVQFESYSPANLPEEYSNYFKFGFVRNPWDRIVSCFVNKIKADSTYNEYDFTNGVSRDLQYYGSFYAGMPFEEFVENILLIDDEDADSHFRSQVCFLKDASGSITLDYIGRYENLADDYAYVQEKIGLQDYVLPKLNPTYERTEAYPQYYTNNAQEKVAQRYAEDIETFSYSF